MAIEITYVLSNAIAISFANILTNALTIVLTDALTDAATHTITDAFANYFETQHEACFQQSQAVSIDRTIQHGGLCRGSALAKFDCQPRS